MIEGYSLSSVTVQILADESDLNTVPFTELAVLTNLGDETVVFIDLESNINYTHVSVLRLKSTQGIGLREVEVYGKGK